MIKDLDDVALTELQEAIAELETIGKMSANEYYRQMDADFKEHNQVLPTESAIAQLAAFKTLAWQIANLFRFVGLEEADNAQVEHESSV